jgi:putative zinc finger protein
VFDTPPTSSKKRVNQRVLLHRARSRAPRSKGTSMAESHDHVGCTEVVELVTDYLEGSLPPDAAALVEHHLNCCEGCVWYVDQIRTTIEALGRIEPEEVPPRVRAQLLTAFRDWTRS